MALLARIGHAALLPWLDPAPTAILKSHVPRFTGITAQPQLPHNNVILLLNLIMWSLIGMAAAFLALRIYCKLSRQRDLWWDDYVLAASWLALAVSGVFVTVSSSRGFGKHIYDVSSRDLAALLLTLNLGGFFSILSAAWSKTSFAITLLRISTGGVRKWIWFIIISVNIFLHVAGLLTWLQCTPVKRTWNPFVKGTCWNPTIFIVYNSSAAAYSGICDIALATIPWKIIGRTSMNRNERMGMLVAMSMGVFAGATSIAKTITIPAIANSDLINTVPLILLGAAESAVTIMAASMPVLRALIKTNQKRQSVNIYTMKGSSIVVATPKQSDSSDEDDKHPLESEDLQTPRQARKPSPEEGLSPSWVPPTPMRPVRTPGDGLYEFNDEERPYRGSRSPVRV